MRMEKHGRGRSASHQIKQMTQDEKETKLLKSSPRRCSIDSSLPGKRWILPVKERSCYSDTSSEKRDISGGLSAKSAQECKEGLRSLGRSISVDKSPEPKPILKVCFDTYAVTKSSSSEDISQYGMTPNCYRLPDKPRHTISQRKTVSFQEEVNFVGRRSRRLSSPKLSINPDHLNLDDDLTQNLVETG
ncbi:hypothetical protein CHS0354_042606 [Potamilus streckersoni]|uniref:Uncharacterized protein n=1 Tax=Potamilus streckersoni TaxID=2493646 RepID=A0AAE0WBZ0_9BIVA|nr:hypothetical protein CHS0354_042606 [Potamilus streckersoni]